MKDEIKEILEFKENADYKRLSYGEIKILSDTISNLQEELEIMIKDDERLNNIIERIDSKLCSTWQLYYDHSRLTTFKCEDMLDLIEQIRKDIKELKEGK